MEDMSNDGLRELLYTETGGIAMSDELFERLLGATVEIHLKNKEALISYGKLDTNLYIQKRGIMRGYHFDGENEKTYAFAGPGTVTLSFHSHFLHQPSVFQIESCGETTVLKLSKKQLDELLAQSHEFALWLLAIYTSQLYFYEYKEVVIKGSARERYLSLIENRPEILANVPLKTVASYLGVAPNYLSTIKKIIRDEKKM